MSDDRGEEALPVADTIVEGSGSQPIVRSDPGAIEVSATRRAVVVDTGPMSSPVERAASPDLEPGATIAHFRITRKIGEGGMGAVYLARDESLDRDVALKVLRPEMAGDEELTRRFLREARAQARINHPAIVHIYFIGNEGGGLFFAMELVEGEPLDGLLARGEKMEPESARRAMIEIASALREAQGRGFIHRDIKPSNLLRDVRGHVKVADFGLVKPLGGGAEDVKLSHAGLILGSPLYMAPEQARGEQVDHRADMYALGASFYHLLSGEPPFDGNNPVSVITKHQFEPAPPLAQKLPTVPRALAAIVDRLLLKTREQRFATYDELIHALEDAAPTPIEYARFGTRAAGSILDFFVLAALVGSTVTFVPSIAPLAIAIHVVYLTVAHKLWGQTLGKYAVRIKLVRPDGAAMSWSRAIARTLVSLWLPGLAAVGLAVVDGPYRLYHVVAGRMPGDAGAAQDLLVSNAVSYGFHLLLWMAGFLYAIVDTKHRALHDLAAGSVVIHYLSPKKRAAAPPRAR